MKNFILVFILFFIYTSIVGFFDVYIPIYITKTFGYKYIWIYSISLLIAMLLMIFIIKNITRLSTKRLLIYGFVSIFLAALFTMLYKWYYILIATVFIGLSDPIVWGVIKAYFARVSKNTKEIQKYISVYGVSIVLGFVFSGILITLVFEFRRMVLFCICFISLISIILSLFLEKDYKTQSTRSSIRLNLKVMLAGILILSHGVFVISVPSIFKSMKLPNRLISMYVLFLCVGMAIASLLIYLEDYRKIEFYMILSLFFASISVIIFFIIMFIFKIYNIGILMAIPIGIFANLIYSNLYLFEIQKLSSIIDPDIISLLFNLSLNISIFITIILSSIVYIYIVLLSSILFLIEIVYMKKILPTQN